MVEITMPKVPTQRKQSERPNSQDSQVKVNKEEIYDNANIVQNLVKLKREKSHLEESVRRSKRELDILRGLVLQAKRQEVNGGEERDSSLTD
jgi:hypothetical protein